MIYTSQILVGSFFTLFDRERCLCCIHIKETNSCREKGCLTRAVGITPWIDLKNSALSFIGQPKVKQSGDLEHIICINYKIEQDMK